MPLIYVALLEDAYIACCLLALSSLFADCRLRPNAQIAVAVVALALAGYAAFWISWLSWPIGNALRYAFCLFAMGMLASAIYYRRISGEALLITSIFVFTSFAATMIGHAGSDLSHPLAVAAGRWTSPPLPMDNTLPWLFQQGIMKGAVPSPLAGDWLASDRPPLQVGLNLLLDVSSFGSPELVYQVTSIALQCLSIIAIWCLARALGGTRKTAILAVAALFFTPVFLVNSVFVWPKLLSAALISIAFVLHFCETEQPQTRATAGAITGLAAGLSFLSHGTAAFAILGLLFTAIAMRRFGSWSYLAAAGASFVAIVLPWSAYQRFIDPPGNRLLKWHLAGVIKPDDRTFLRALHDSYANLTLDSWLAGRLANLENLFRGVQSYIPIGVPWSEVYSDHFHYFMVSCGLIGISLLASPVIFIKSRSLRPLIIALWGTLATWAFAMFIPGETFSHQGTYFSQMMLITTTILFLSSLSDKLVIGLISCSVAWTSVLYIWPHIKT